MWYLTVAAVIRRGEHFLLIEEIDDPGTGPVLNQPAGHVEAGEHPLDAVIREAREEAGVAFTPTALLGLYPLVVAPDRQYLRLAFLGSVPEDAVARPEDADILACHWLTAAELAGRRLRSPLVRACIDDALAGRALPLSALHPLAHLHPHE